MARKTKIYTIKHWDGAKWNAIRSFEGKTKAKAESWMWGYIKENGYFADEFTLATAEA